MDLVRAITFLKCEGLSNNLPDKRYYDFHFLCCIYNH